MSPGPFELFCLYHLGVDRDLGYKFRNANQASAYFRLSVDELQELLKAHRLDAETVRRVPFNMSRAHADAQILAITQGPTALKAHCREQFEAYTSSLDDFDADAYFEDIDYDNIWND